jgi:outer membrane protein
MRHMTRGVLAVLLLWTSPLAVRAETLADALAYGYESSGLIDQNRALLRAADEGVAQAVAALRPIISYSATTQANFVQVPTFATIDTGVGDPQVVPSGIGRNIVGTSSLGVSASLLLFDGGNSQLAIDQQKEVVLATRESLLQIEQQVLLRIVQAYMEIRRSQAFIELRENNVRLITQELRAAEERFEVGEVTRTDVALAQSQLAAARSLLAAEQGTLAQAIEEFRAAVGRAPQNLQPAPPARIGQSVSEAKAIAQATHPSIRQAQHQIAAAEIGVRRAEASLRPSLSLDSRIAVDENFDDTASIGLTLSGPIYQGGGIASAIRETQANRDAQRASLIETARTIDQNVGTAYAILEVSRASQQGFSEQVRAATIAFEGVREEAELGARTTLDVLDAEQTLLDARASLVSAQVDETVASYLLLSSMGLLTVENLGLRVQTYDPTAYYNLVDDAPSAISDQGRALDRVLEAIGGN